MHNIKKIQVYHGSDHIIHTPIYLGGKDDNDYGNGFYTTEYEDRAKSWAALNGDPSHSIVNKYELDLDGLNVLNLGQVRKRQRYLEKGLLKCIKWTRPHMTLLKGIVQMTVIHR